jgi:hypothetical protein
MPSLRKVPFCLSLAIVAFCMRGQAQAATTPPFLSSCRPAPSRPVPSQFLQTPSIRPAAAQVRRVEPADLTFQAVATSEGDIQVEARGGNLVFRKKVRADGSFDLALEGRGDAVAVTFDQDTITIVRNRRRVAIAVGTKIEGPQLQEGLTAAQRLLAGSSATGLLRLAATAVQDAEDDSAASASLLVADALIGMLTGDPGAPGRVARYMARHARARVQRAAMQTDCYYSWEGSVLHASYEWESCASAFSVWNPVRHLCALRWTIQIESYWFTFLSCTGFSAF